MLTGEFLTLDPQFGGRYTKDDKETMQTGMVNAANDESWNEFTPGRGLRYEFSDNLMALRRTQRDIVQADLTVV